MGWCHPHEVMVFYLYTVFKISPSVQNLLTVTCWSPWVLLYFLMSCVENIPFFFFTGTVAEDTLWFPCWLLLERGHRAGEVLVSVGCFSSERGICCVLHGLSVNPQTTVLAVKTSDLSFLEECIFMWWYDRKSLFHATTVSTLRTDTFKFTYRLLYPLSSKFFPSFLRGGNAALIITKKPEYF